MSVLRAVDAVNERQKGILVDKLLAHCGGDVAGRTVALWGLAFKPETDDMREAPSLVVMRRLLDLGARLRVYDPVAMTECRRRMGDAVEYGTDMYDAAAGADALMLLTEWNEFRMPSWNVLQRVMNAPLIIDGRNIYDPEEVADHGFTYYKIG